MNIKKYLLFICFTMLAISCNQTNNVNSQDQNPNLYDPQYVLDLMQENPRTWHNSRDPKLHYTISMGVDSLLTIQYRPLNSQVDVTKFESPKWLSTREKVLSEIKRIDPKVVYLKRAVPTPFIRIKSHSFEVFEALCKMEIVYSMEVASEKYIMGAIQKGFKYPLMEEYLEGLKNMKDY